MTRSARNSPTAAPPSSSAILRVEASWLVSAPTPTNTGTIEAVARASSAEPPTGRPDRTRPANSAIPRIRTPAAIAASAERYAVPRPTEPASTSSMRPVSSSVRSARTAASSPNTEAKIASVPPTRQAV